VDPEIIGVKLNKNKEISASKIYSPVGKFLSGLNEYIVVKKFARFGATCKTEGFLVLTI